MASTVSRGPGLAVLDLIVIAAMAITATAFAAGLIVNSGIDTMPGVVAGAALFMVMASAHFALTRTARSGPVSGRIDQLEEAVLILDSDLQRIDQVEDDVARLDLLTDRVERLDQAMVNRDESGEGFERIDRLSTDFENLHARLDALRTDLESEARAQREKISSELRLLEGLFKQLSREFTAAAGNGGEPGTGEAYRARTALPPIPSEIEIDDLVAEVRDAIEIAEESGDDVETVSGEEPAILVSETLVLTDVALVLEDEDEDAVEELSEPAAVNAGAIVEAIQERSIELHLQPIFDLTTRKVRYLEALSRLRAASDELVQPEDFIPVAEAEGLMPQIDNMMLVKSVQLLRRLGPDSVEGVFCNISTQSLLDAEFYPELIEFMEENSALGDSLFFEFAEKALLALSPNGLENLNALGQLGFRFSLNHVADLDIDYAGLRDNYFRFVKIPAALLDSLDEAGIGARQLKRELEGFGLTLIVERLEDASSLDRLKDLDIELAQGHALAAPKPFGSDLLRGLDETGAA
jgi:cyclic-di-GMP phosphodiesterase TipF (flagellum assembly factor)